MRKLPTLKFAFRYVLCAGLAISMPLAVTGAKAQSAPPSVGGPTYTPTLTFDIVSIRQTAGITDRSLKVGVKSPVHASGFEATNFMAKTLLQAAYGYGTPIAGGPDWLTERFFNIQAKSDSAADEKMAKLSDDDAKLEKQHMLQALLAERLGLKYHMETRETSVYELVVAKNGSKLQEIKAEASDPDQPKATPGADIRATGGAQGLEFTVQNATTRSIAAILVSQVETPIIDRTGLTGTYKFTLQFGRDWSAANPDGWPSLFTALQEQLGLKLNSTKASIPVLVIDHIEMPSAN